MMYIEIVPRVVEDGAGFVAEQFFSYYDYRFSGYTVRRDNDNKWYVSGKGRLTQEEINAGGYSKKLYAPDEKVTVDASWKRGITGECSFTLVAQWRRGDGVVGDANGDGEVDLIDAMMIILRRCEKGKRRVVQKIALRHRPRSADRHQGRDESFFLFRCTEPCNFLYVIV